MTYLKLFGRWQRKSSVGTGFILSALFAMMLMVACSSDSASTPIAPTETPRPTPRPVTTSPDLDGVLTVAWVENGVPAVWRSDNVETIRQINAENGVRVVIAPDGEHMLIVQENTRGEQSLAIASTNGGDVQPVEGDVLPTSGDGLAQIGQIAWVDDTTLLYNTSLVERDFYAEPQNNLFRLNIDTLTVERLLNAGEGGAFTLSPDGAQIAIIAPGTYNEPNGAIRLYNLRDGGGLQTVMNFDGVSTGSHFPFYPQISWVDASTFRVAIPHPDQLYNENEPDAPPFQLYQAEIGADVTEIGTVRASLFGVPVWNDSGTRMAFLRRATPNTIEIVINDVGDDAEIALYRGEVGTIISPQWTETGHLVAVNTRLTVLREDGTQGEVETTPVSGNFVIAGDIAVFSTLEDSAYTLYYVVLDDDTLTPFIIINGLEARVFSAVFVAD